MASAAKPFGARLSVEPMTTIKKKAVSTTSATKAESAV